MLQTQSVQDRLQTIVADGVARRSEVIRRVLGDTPADSIVRTSRLGFVNEPDGPVEMVAGNDGRWTLHHNALQQLGQRLSMPTAYIDDLNGTSWGRELLTANLQTLVRNRFAEEEAKSPTRMLVRSVRGQARAVLSDNFRRIDSRPILEQLLKSFDTVGAVVTDGYAGDVKVSLKAVLPRVVEPVPGEFMVFGISWTNSDFGRGAMAMDAFALRLVCVNGMIAESQLRKVHLGARLHDDLTYSQRTYDLDTRTIASALGDQVRGLLEPAKVEQLTARIRKAAESEIDPAARLAALRTKLTKGEVGQISEIFNGADVVNLPAGNTSWRLSNAISYLANQIEDGERRLEMQKLAGEVAA